jgi:hypothetical protein
VGIRPYVRDFRPAAPAKEFTSPRWGDQSSGRRTSQLLHTTLRSVLLGAGVRFGRALLVIGAVIVALTLIGFFTIGEAFPLWMDFVNGGGLILGGLWMRRI